MSWLGRTVGRVFGGGKTAVTKVFVRRTGGPQAKYDAAQTTDRTRALWLNADDLGPNGANCSHVRGILRRRARQERDNDPYLNGLVKQLAHDLVGTGPRLQLVVGSDQYESARTVARDFAAWCRAVDLADKLRVMQEARPIDGESFGQLVTNESMPHPVKLDLRVMESEQVEDPTGETDGIRYDAAGNPTSYHVLREHPGDTGYHRHVGYGEGDWVPARNVVHWYRPGRPGQGRGVCELASALAVGSQTRRYSAAVLDAAELGASIAGVMTTDIPVPEENGTPAEIEALDTIPLARGGLMTLFKGCDAKGFDTKQPTTNYPDYVKEQRSAMGRPLSASRNTVTGDSSDFNFASGRLDLLPQYRAAWIERERLRKRVLDRVFLAWVREAELVGLIPDELPAVNEWVWDWHWDGFDSLDPVKEATATEAKLRMRLTTLSEVCAADGKDWREVIDQAAEEADYARSKGFDLDALYGVNKPAPAAAQPAGAASDDD